MGDTDRVFSSLNKRLLTYLLSSRSVTLQTPSAAQMASWTTHE